MGGGLFSLAFLPGDRNITVAFAGSSAAVAAVAVVAIAVVVVVIVGGVVEREPCCCHDSSRTQTISFVVRPCASPPACASGVG